MKMQHSVLISLGSNLGNREENLQRCVAMLHESVGTVVKTSTLYETDAWGFTGEPFLNCVLILHTHLKPQKLLKRILKLETELGRVRSDATGYQSRTIDIDILTFNDEVIREEGLEIPHPLMHERLFVLRPLQELLPDFQDPISGNTITTLLEECKDKGACRPKTKLIEPLEAIKLQRFNYIAIEGNIGAGKTTLAGKIADDFNGKIVLERFADNPFLPKFYKDQSRYAFPLEMSFLADRYQQISDDLSQFDLFKDFVVADYHIFKSLIFAKVTLADDEYRLYKTLFDIIYKEMPKPDLYVYLYQNTARLLQNIKKRGRSYEQEIPADYLDRINNGYLDYIKTQQDLNVLIIDVSERDFVKNQSDYLFILNAIRDRISVLS